jgi:hypothetical protein
VIDVQGIDRQDLRKSNEQGIRRLYFILMGKLTNAAAVGRSERERLMNL